jgi:S-DNA-T family DNA segregation ATPase FtsK/SpoIIIE
MNYLLTLCANCKIYELELSQGETATIGSGESDTLKLELGGLEQAHLTFTAVGMGVHASSLSPMKVKDESVSNLVLAVGDIVRLPGVLSLSVFEKRCDMDGVILLEGRSDITMGRSSGSDICMGGMQVSSNHALLRRGRGWVIEDRGSSNGTFVDGKLIEFTPLEDNAVIFIGGWKFIFSNDALYFENTAGHTSLSSKVKYVGCPSSEQATEAPYPFFQRSPRIKPNPQTSEVEILPPPNPGAQPSVSWLSILLPPVMMMLVMLIVALLMKNPTMLYYTVPMSGVSIIVAVVNYKSQMKKWMANHRLAQEKYAQHLDEQENTVTRAETDYLLALSSVNPDVHTCAGIAERVDRRLWERVIKDEDFLEIRLGVGQTPSNVEIKIPRSQLSIEEDPLLKEASVLKNKHLTLSGVPVTHSFASYTITGLAGSRQAIQRAAWTIMMSVAVHHSYEDVKIVCVYPQSEKQAWEWTRWLPHVWNEGRTGRYIACTTEDARPMLRELGDLLKARRRDSGDRADRETPQTPFYFLVLADKSLTEESGAVLLPENVSLGMAAVYAYGGLELLPGECRAIITCGDDRSSIQLKSSTDRTNFTPERVTPEMLDSFARNLAPVRFRSASADSSMPDYVTFLQGFKVQRVEDLNVIARWSGKEPYKSIAAPIGIRENGEVFSFDIHEKGMGPHGIVAGATRWGKSETLTTWLLSVALNYHPHEVSFVLIDFKGDGLSGILMDLPHVAGVISNVDDISSIERNLRSLHGELIRRQRVFKETKLENIHKYQEAYRNGCAPEPMPYLIIVIDEFAELKTQFPDQMNEFISIARVGGSLGVYMVLATQSPGGGIVSGQVSANSRFRICLKTSEAGESKDILGTNDAFRITVRGRAYVKVGNNEVYEQVQTFFSKAPYDPEAGRKGPVTKISVVETNGLRTHPEVHEKTDGASGGDFSEGRAVAQYIKETAAKNGVSNVKQVWTEALPERIFLPEVMPKREIFQNGAWPSLRAGLSVIVGLVDDPEGQRQYPLVLNFAEDGHQSIYGAPSSGKTTFLQTLLLSTALLYSPGQVQFLILDFGSWGMKIFEGLPHTLLVADANDVEKVRRAEEFLSSELASRKAKFSAQGVGTLEAYREITGEAVPSIIIAIDNIASLYNLYPDMLDSLADIAREGGGLGLYLVLTAGGQGSFMFRIAQYIKTSYALQLTDKADYRQLVGGNGRMEPAHFPGRGFAKGPMEFQTALCVEGAREGERVKNLRDICSAMSGAWGAKSALRTTPDEIDAESMSFSRESAQIGFEKKTSSPYEFVFRDMNGCVISGLPGAGKTNALGLLVRALIGDPETYVFLYGKNDAIAPTGDRIRIAREGPEFDAFLTALAAEYDRRSEGGGDSSRVAVCIDDFEKFYEEISDEGVGILDLIVRYGDEYGMYVYIAGDMLGLTRLHNLFVKALENSLVRGNAIVTGGRLKDHGVFNDMHDEEDATILSGECFVIHGRKARHVKLAKLKTAVAENA